MPKILGGSPIGTLDHPNGQMLKFLRTIWRANLVIRLPIRLIAD